MLPKLIKEVRAIDVFIIAPPKADIPSPKVYALTFALFIACSVCLACCSTLSNAPTASIKAVPALPALN